jgi:predicted PurR-regulated permease PerM
MTENPNPPEPPGRNRRIGILILALAIAALLPAAYRMARPFLDAMVLAAILAVVLDPLQRRAQRLVPRSSLAALLTTLAAVVPAIAVILLAGTAIDRQIKSSAFAGIRAAGKRLTANPSIDPHAIQEAAAQLGQIAGGFFTGALAALFLYVLLVRGRAWVAQLKPLVPLDAPVTDRLLDAIRDAIVANVDGILAVAGVEAVLYGVVFWVAGDASPAMWGAIAGLASMLPVVGALAVWLPVAVTMAIHGAYVKALVVGSVCLVAQEAVALLLLPRVVGGRLRQPPLLIALAVLGGASAFGALGILLGPVIVSVLAALVQEFRIQLRPQADSPPARETA